MSQFLKKWLRAHRVVPFSALKKCVRVMHEGACSEVGLRVASNKSWRQRGAGEEEGGVRDGGGPTGNRRRDAPRNEGINQLKVGRPAGKGRGNVGVERAGYLYCKLC